MLSHQRCRCCYRTRHNHLPRMTLPRRSRSLRRRAREFTRSDRILSSARGRDRPSDGRARSVESESGLPPSFAIAHGRRPRLRLRAPGPPYVGSAAVGARNQAVRRMNLMRQPALTRRARVPPKAWIVRVPATTETLCLVPFGITSS